MIEEDTHTFENLLLQAIDDGLTKILGSDAARAVKFYVDPRIASRNADSYARSLERMFMDGAKVMIIAIEDTLCDMTGLDKRDWRSLAECVSAARQKHAARAA